MEELPATRETSGQGSQPPPAPVCYRSPPGPAVAEVGASQLGPELCGSAAGCCWQSCSPSPAEPCCGAAAASWGCWGGRVGALTRAGQGRSSATRAQRGGSDARVLRPSSSRTLHPRTLSRSPAPQPCSREPGCCAVPAVAGQPKDGCNPQLFLCLLLEQHCQSRAARPLGTCCRLE